MCPDVLLRKRILARSVMTTMISVQSVKKVMPKKMEFASRVVRLLRLFTVTNALKIILSAQKTDAKMAMN